jgi:uncharacterized membrane protein YeaQ/YmgE (transglycosylase-associated protein family)
MDLTSILIQLIAGAVGGNVAGLANKAKSLGPVINTILGALGGVGGGQLADRMTSGGTGTEVGAAAIVGALVPLLGGMLNTKKTTP